MVAVQETIRITDRDKWLDQVQVVERKGFFLPLAGSPKASYTGNKANPRILCGSIYCWPQESNGRD